MRVKWRLGIQGLGRPPSPTSAVSIRHRKRAVKYNKSKLSATYSHTTAKHYEVPFRASGIGQFRKSINRFMRSDNGPCFIVPPQIKHSRLYGFMVDLFAFRNYRGVIIFMVGKVENKYSCRFGFTFGLSKQFPSDGNKLPQILSFLLTNDCTWFFCWDNLLCVFGLYSLQLRICLLRNFKFNCY